MTVSDCETAILTVRPDAHFTITSSLTDDPAVADSHVVSTTPTATTDPAPADVGLQKDEDNGQPETCTATTDNPHWSKELEDAGTPSMLAYGRITCDYTGVAPYQMKMWACSSNPVTEDANSLDAGTDGCVNQHTTARVADVMAKQVTFVYCPYVSLGESTVAWT